LVKRVMVRFNISLDIEIKIDSRLA